MRYFRKKNHRNKGQVVVEYVLVIAMIVGVALTAYLVIRKRLTNPLAVIKKKMRGTETFSGNDAPVGKSAGSGDKDYRYYYGNVEFKAK